MVGDIFNFLMTLHPIVDTHRSAANNNNKRNKKLTARRENGDIRKMFSAGNSAGKKKSPKVIVLD